jgi:cytochrome c biogenesis protein
LKSLTSIRLTIFLLLVLAGVAVLGTLVPQDQPPQHYFMNYGETLGSLLWRAGFTRIYSSPWFLAPVSLLALNILVCLINGLPQALRRCRRRFSWETAQDLPERGRFAWPPGVDPHSLVTTVLSRELGRPRKESLPDKEVYLYERGRWRPLGPYLVHLALLLILAGGLIGKFWGIEGRLSILEGETANAFEVDPGGEQPLDFTVRLDRFKVQFYEPGSAPKEFRSDLTFLNNGREVARRSCRVNEPVSFGGLTFYQSSYGAQPTGPVRLKACQGDDCEVLELPFRRMADLPGGKGQLMVMRLDGNLQGYGPAVQLALRSGPGHPQVFWVFQDHPEVADQPGLWRFSVVSVPWRFYSVFQVKRDPGVWWVYAGFLLLLPGFYLAFLRPAQRWAVVLEPTPKGGVKGRLLGAGPRAREDFAVRQERILEMLKRGSL